MSDLYARYDEIMSFREEAVRRYNATAYSLKGPPALLRFPSVSFTDVGLRGKRIGPLVVADRPPIAPYVESILNARKTRATILEIGPGRGDLAKTLRKRFPTRIASYYGLERDAAVRGPYERVASVLDIEGDIDVVIAAEVIEHMAAQAFFDSILDPLLPKMASTATMIFSLPNPTAPGGIARDFTHVQNYPWYDLYAVLRLAFEDVRIYRIHYAFSLKRLLMVIPRYVVSAMLELEWCDQLVAVASVPKATAADLS